MKRLLLLVAVFVGTLSLSAQRNMQVWEGNTYSEFSTEVVDSVTFLLSPEGVLRECKADTVFVTKTDTVEKIVTKADTVIKYDTVTVIQKDTVYIKPKESKVVGRFAVSADKQVSFSHGNLQYIHSNKIWLFAEHQYDVIGGANVSNGALADKIDLFGWSASNFTAPFGAGISANDADYAGDFVDWGTNTIGNDAPNTWRTLTSDEWTYLFQHTRWTMARVNGILGFMLLPDDFVPAVGMTVTFLSNGNLPDSSMSFDASDYANNVYTADQFAEWEAKGVVFLPCAGYREGSRVREVGSSGYYWSATPHNGDYAGFMVFYSSFAYTYYWNNRHCGQSVRLVRDIE